MPTYMMSHQGDKNHIDEITRQKLVQFDVDYQIIKLFKIGWFILGIIVGSILHDKLFHPIEMIMR